MNAPKKTARWSHASISKSQFKAHVHTRTLSLCRDSELSWNISNKFFCHIGDRTHDSKCDVQ